MLIFMFPETKWHRVHHAELVAGTPVLGEIEHEKGATLTNLVKPSPTPSETVEPESLTKKGGPSKQQFTICQAKDPRTTLLNEIWTPWKLFGFPIVQFASFVVSWSASLFLTVNLTQAQNFAAPPYNYSSEVIGESAIPHFPTTFSHIHTDPVCRSLQCCGIDRGFHRVRNGRTTVGLDIDEINKEEPWHSRTRNETHHNGAVRVDYDHQQRYPSCWISAVLVMEGEFICFELFATTSKRKAHKPMINRSSSSLAIQVREFRSPPYQPSHPRMQWTPINLLLEPSSYLLP